MRRWMGNYTPVIANEMCRSRSAQELRMTSLAKREEQAKQGTGWGSGAIPGISVKADARLGSLPKRFLITKK